MSLRDRIIAADDIGCHLVDVQEWGVEVEVRTLSAGMRARMLKSAQTASGEVDVELLYPTVLIATCFDPETGEPVFTSDDVQLIQEKSAMAVETLAQKAMEVSGMLGTDSVDTEGKDS